MSGCETVTRSRGTTISSTPSFTSTLMSKSSPMRLVTEMAVGADLLAMISSSAMSMVLAGGWRERRQIAAPSWKVRR